MNKFKKLGGFIVFLNSAVCLYLYFIVGACLLSLVPNINPNYPLFHYIFKFAGFYLIPPIFGFSFSPMVIMITLVLISMGLQKVYAKYFKEETEVYVIPSEEILRQVKSKELEINNISEDNTAEKEENSEKENNE